jgi:hypothetical protein
MNPYQNQQHHYNHTISHEVSSKSNVNLDNADWPTLSTLDLEKVCIFLLFKKNKKWLSLRILIENPKPFGAYCRRI